MAIKLKAKETLIQVGKYAGTYRYLLSPELYTKLTESKVIAEAALRSGLTPGNIANAWDAIGSVIRAWATEGHSVAIPGLGTMRFGMNATSVSVVEKVSSDLITSRKVIFTPSKDIKAELKDIRVTISCYDRTGKLVRTVTSGDAATGDFELELLSSPEGGGTFEGAGFYNEGEEVTVKAVPAEGYQFVKWDDDETSAERTITVSEDMSLVATFKKVAGSTSGSGSTSQGSGTNQGGSSTQGGGQQSGGTTQPPATGGTTGDDGDGFQV